MKLIHFSLLVALGVAATGCNVFSPLDKPSGDAQLLSAARACLNKGDFACASTYYQQLSSAYADVATSEQAYLVLDQQGADMGAFARFIGDGGNGSALTTFAETLASSAGQAKRVALFSAYNSASSITDTNLKSFVQFVTSLALAGEVLAEIAANHGNTLYAADITNTGGVLKFGTVTNPPTVTDFNVANPTSDMLWWAMKYAYTAESALQPGGAGQTASTGLSLMTGTEPTTSGNDTTFRQLVTDKTIGFGVGR